jgi:hypothetical protein
METPFIWYYLEVQPDQEKIPFSQCKTPSLQISFVSCKAVLYGTSHPGPSTPIHALAMAGDRERCLEAGANEYISKPFSFRKLLSSINQYLSQNR